MLLKLIQTGRLRHKKRHYSSKIALEVIYKWPNTLGFIYCNGVNDFKGRDRRYWTGLIEHGFMSLYAFELTVNESST